MRRLLVANRGEIAVRVMRAAKALGLETVAVHSDADAKAMHVSFADAAVRIGPPPARESYLDVAAILAAAHETGADAVHPGYGFLAENARFAEAVEAAGLAWVGPSAKSIEDMGDKERARMIARAAGVPVLPGSARFGKGDTAGIEEAAIAVGYPLLVKAAGGGGGIGMRRVDGPDQLLKTVEATQSLAERSFGDGTVYLERYVPKARHVEIQVFGLGDGHAVHLYERDCSIQRRFQKIVEESPAPGIPRAVIQRMADAARALAAAERYRGAGTMEFVVDAVTHEFYFLEMNTRIQVEHPVTEMVTGVDLVASQIRLARGDSPAVLFPAPIEPRGHALECRLYAENPAKMFLPSPGRLAVFETPVGMEGVRVDTGVREGDEITVHYDPMIAKLIAHGATRDEAIRRMLAALGATRVEGIATNRDFLMRLLDNPQFRDGDVYTTFVDEHRKALAS
ncbi:MAG: biotin carboxylase N-terminal domain-containing protein [Hyphomicrobiaceae bacterium]